MDGSEESCPFGIDWPFMVVDTLTVLGLVLKFEGQQRSTESKRSLAGMFA